MAEELKNCSNENLQKGLRHYNGEATVYRHFLKQLTFFCAITFTVSGAMIGYMATSGYEDTLSKNRVVLTQQEKKERESIKPFVYGSCVALMLMSGYGAYFSRRVYKRINENEKKAKILISEAKQRNSF